MLPGGEAEWLGCSERALRPGMCCPLARAAAPPETAPRRRLQGGGSRTQKAPPGLGLHRQRVLLGAW